MRRPLAAVGILLTIAGLTACSGGGSSAGATAGPPATAASPTTTPSTTATTVATTTVAPTTTTTRAPSSTVAPSTTLDAAAVAAAAPCNAGEVKVDRQSKRYYLPGDARYGRLDPSVVICLPDEATAKNEGFNRGPAG